MITYPAYKVAIAHVAPVFLDLEATLGKACSLIEEAAQNGARIVAFPEAYIPAFPVWSALRAPIHNHDLFKRLACNAVRVPGPEVAKICDCARESRIIVSMGINEGTDISVGCIWNANLLIGEDGSILNHHRKLVPTFFEKMTWANGDGAGLRVSDTPLGRIGALICGENTNPLARYALVAQGEQVHVSTYPPAWPTKDPKEGGNYDLAGAIRVRAGAHSFEAKCFNIVASGFMDKPMRDAMAELNKDAGRILDNSPRGVSMVIGPDAETVGDVISDSEGILYVDIDLEACVEPKQFHDVVGYYNRFDIFKLTVDRSENRPVTFTAEDISQEADTSRESDPNDQKSLNILEITG